MGQPSDSGIFHVLDQRPGPVTRRSGAAVSRVAAPSAHSGLTLDSAQGRWVLLATVLGSAMASVGATVVGIARPAIGRDLGTGLSGLQWVVTAYTFTLAGLLLIAGAIGDKYGRKKIFLAGVIWFTLASLLCIAAASWRLIFVINVPIAAVVAAVAWQPDAETPSTMVV